MEDDRVLTPLKYAKPAEIESFSPPTYEKDADAWSLEAAEVVIFEEIISQTDSQTMSVVKVGTGLYKAKCPKCSKIRPLSELSLWPDPEQTYRPRFLCSGCRSDINRREDTLYKDQMLIVLQQYGVEVPEKLIQWMRVQCRIAEHPGSPTVVKEIDVAASIAQDKIVVKEVPGGRTGIRSTIGVVD